MDYAYIGILSTRALRVAVSEPACFLVSKRVFLLAQRKE